LQPLLLIGKSIQAASDANCNLQSPIIEHWSIEHLSIMHYEHHDFEQPRGSICYTNILLRRVLGENAGGGAAGLFFFPVIHQQAGTHAPNRQRAASRGAGFWIAQVQVPTRQFII
jgi:hypothetical protein